MRILIISSYFPPEILGGLEQSAFESALGLHNRGHEIEVLSCGWRKPNQSEIAPFPVHRTLGFSNPSQYYGHSIRTVPRRFKDAHANVHVGRANLQMTRDFLKGRNYDLVAVWAFAGIGTSVTHAVDEAGIPLVWHVGDQNLRERVNPHIVNRIIYSLVSIPWYRSERTVNVHNVLVNSHFMRRKYLAKGFAPECLGVTYRAMNAAQVFETPGAKANPPRIVTACRIIAQKGLDVAIRALAELRSMPGTENVELHVIGDGDAKYTASLERLAESLGVRPALTLHGKGSRDDVLRHMREASVVLSASTHDEGFGRVNIEAMATASPLLASDLENVHEIGTDEVELLLYKPFDHEGMAKQAHRILTDPALADRLVKAGTKRLREAFVQDIIDQQIEDYYAKVLAGIPVGLPFVAHSGDGEATRIGA